MASIGISLSDVEALSCYENVQDYIEHISKIRQIENLQFKANIAEAVAMAIQATQPGNKNGNKSYSRWFGKIRQEIQKLSEPKKEETLFQILKKSKKEKTLFDELKAEKVWRLKQGQFMERQNSIQKNGVQD